MNEYPYTYDLYLYLTLVSGCWTGVDWETAAGYDDRTTRITSTLLATHIHRYVHAFITYIHTYIMLNSKLFFFSVAKRRF
jgi:hypothetical protein